MKKLLWTLIAAAGLAQAQQDAQQRVQRLIEVKYADPARLTNLLNGPGVSMRYDSSMHVLQVSGTAQAVTELEAMVKKLDVPPADIELTVYLLSGNSQASADEVPKDLTPTTKQLHALFPYKSYQVLQSFVMRSRDGQGGNNGGVLAGANAEYNFGYRAASVSGGQNSGGAARVVRIDALNLTVAMPTGQVNSKGDPQKRAARIESDIDVREGQQVVVGKSSLNQRMDDAIILVISAKVIE